MWRVIPAGTDLYRVTRLEDDWGVVLKGIGAFYAAGSRYNGAGLETVYVSRDPVVALTEYGFHVAVGMCEDLAKGLNPLAYPLVAAAKLWRFTLNTDVTLIDLSHATARHQFNFPAHALLNPCFHNYDRTQAIGRAVMLYHNPPAPHHRPEGLIAPSVRTPRRGQYQPELVVLFVFPAGPGAVVDESLQDRGQLVDQWDVELQVQTAGTNPVAVGPNAPRVGWLNPRFRLAGNPHSIPPHPNRPNGQPIPANQWRRIDAQFAAV